MVAAKLANMKRGRQRSIPSIEGIEESQPIDPVWSKNSADP
jgi:hypothetical protein